MPKSTNKRQRLSLPSRVVSGDRFKIKAELVAKYREGCKLAGYNSFDPDHVHTAIAVEQDGPSRVMSMIQPFYFNQRDVIPYYPSDKERLEHLTGLGWYQSGSGKWFRKVRVA